MNKIWIDDQSYFLLKSEFKDELELKNYTEQLNELEEVFMKEINKTIFNLLQVKFSKNIGHLVKYQITPIVKDIFDENNFWAKEIREALYNYVKEDAKQLSEQRAQLNIRMDFIEQRFIDLLRRFDEVIYSKK